MAEEFFNQSARQSAVWSLYKSIVDDVTNSSREAFAEEGVDDHILQDLKKIWLKKLTESKAVVCPADFPGASPAENATKSSRDEFNTVTATPSFGSRDRDEVPTCSSRISTQQGRPNRLIQLKQQQPKLKQQTTSAGSSAQKQNPPNAASFDPNKIVFVNITLPPQPGVVNAESRIVTIHVPASAVQGNRLAKILTSRIIASILPLPTALASSVLQQHVNTVLKTTILQKETVRQLDGASDIESSDEDKSEEDDGNKGNESKEQEEDDVDTGEEDPVQIEDDPLNTEDDLTSEDDGTDAFETNNTIVCQYERVTRSGNKWKFYLKYGIMNISGKDYVFQRSYGEGEW